MTSFRKKSDNHKILISCSNLWCRTAVYVIFFCLLQKVKRTYYGGNKESESIQYENEEPYLVRKKGMKGKKSKSRKWKVAFERM